MFPFNPLFPFYPIGTRNAIKRVDIGGIYELKTNAQQVTDASVDYGINPSCYNALPCECIVLLKIHQGVATASATLPVTIVTPNSGTTTVNGTSSSGTASGNVTGKDSTRVEIRFRESKEQIQIKDSLAKYKEIAASLLIYKHKYDSLTNVLKENSNAKETKEVKKTFPWFSITSFFIVLIVILLLPSLRLK